MTTYAIGDFLKYANLQLAAEAIGLASGLTDSDLASALVAGNSRASRFPSILADDFGSKYEVVQHRSNTGTGFSGTLFREKATGQLILSFRSTEFIDDAVRDNQATNAMELKEYGWAFGQISDMEAWYRELNQAGGPLEGKQFSVTGYSLGGHLATAFNLLRDEQRQGNRILGTYTFNGAGVGTIDMNVAPTLSYLIQQFDIQRKNAGLVRRLRRRCRHRQ